MKSRNLIFLLVMFSLSACGQPKNEGNFPENWKPLTDDDYIKCDKKYKDDSRAFFANCGVKRPIPTQEELSWLKDYTLKRMVFVQGGRFLMGDFSKEHTSKSSFHFQKNMGWLYTNSDRPYSIYYQEGVPKKHLQALTQGQPYLFVGSHQVQLDDYSISSRLIEEQEYNLYLAAQEKPLYEGTRQKMDYFNLAKEAPVRVQWAEAQGYCQWLGEQMNKPVALPTEAQWEYAARNRGEHRIFATNNGLSEDGINIMYDMDTNLKLNGVYLSNSKHYNFQKKILEQFKNLSPNPLGLYNLQNISEWTGDWFDPDYYSYAPNHNPKG